MAESLSTFLDRALRVVEEDGKTTRAIRLTVAETGETFERWDSPLTREQGGPGAEVLAEQIEELVRSYADSFPEKSTVQMAIIAEDKEGNAKSRHIRTVKGTNRDAKRSILGGDTSLAEGARIHVDTTAKLLNMSSAHSAMLMQQLKISQESQTQLLTLLTLERLEKAEEKKDASEMHPLMAEFLAKLTEQIPQVAGMVQMGLDMASKDKKTALVKAALQATASNGALKGD